MLSAEPKAEADNTYRDLDYIGCLKTQNLTIDLLYIVLKTKPQTHRRKEPELMLLQEIIHCARNLQIRQLSASI